MGRGKRNKKSKKKNNAAPAPKKKPKLTGPGMGPRGKLGPKGTVTKAQQAAKNRIAAKQTAPKATKTKSTPASTGRAPSKTPTKAQQLAKNRIATAASMGATSKSFTDGVSKYSSLVDSNQAKKMFSPTADKGPSFKQSLRMATTPTPAPKVESSKDVASDYTSGEPTQKMQRDNARMILQSGMKLTDDQKSKLMKQATMKLDLAQAGVNAPHTNVRIDTHTDGYGNTTKKVLPNFGAGRVGDVRLKKGLVDAGANIGKSVLTAFNPVAGMSIGGFFGGPANAATVDSGFSPTMPGLAKSLGFDTTTGTYNQSPSSTGLVGVTGGGLNLSGAGFRNMQTANPFQNSATSRVIKPTGNPDVMSPDGTFNRPGPGGPEPEADYTSYQPGSFYNQSDTNMNPTNFLRSTRNVVTTPARMLGINNRFTNMLIPKSNEAIQDARDQRGPRPTLTRPRSRGGARLPVEQPQQPLTPEEILQPQQAAAAQSGPAYQQAGMDNSRLMQIQNDAYSRQMSQIYNPMEIGGFNPMFRFFGRRGGPRRGAFRKAFRRN